MPDRAALLDSSLRNAIMTTNPITATMAATRYHMGEGCSACGAASSRHIAARMHLLVGSVVLASSCAVRWRMLIIRTFTAADEAAVVALWRTAGLTRPWNDPYADIARKQTVQSELFLVGVLDGEIVATAMAGYDGHRGSVYYLAVRPSDQRSGHARALMDEVERRLRAMGCPKLNLMVRHDNSAAIGFYQRIGYDEQSVVTLGKRLIVDEPTER